MDSLPWGCLPPVPLCIICNPHTLYRKHIDFHIYIKHVYYNIDLCLRSKKKEKHTKQTAASEAATEIVVAIMAANIWGKTWGKRH